MSSYYVLRKVRRLEKVFEVVNNPKFIVEVWLSDQGDPAEFERLLLQAEDEIREGKKDIVLVPFGAGEKLKETGLYHDGSGWRFRD